jgi:hypothetical protein
VAGKAGNRPPFNALTQPNPLHRTPASRRRLTPYKAPHAVRRIGGSPFTAHGSRLSIGCNPSI